jgi:hypothetical protein
MSHWAVMSIVSRKMNSGACASTTSTGARTVASLERLTSQASSATTVGSRAASSAGPTRTTRSAADTEVAEPQPPSAAENSHV